jgi:hypothetical protein
LSGELDNESTAKFEKSRFVLLWSIAAEMSIGGEERAQTVRGRVVIGKVTRDSAIAVGILRLCGGRQ